MVTDFSFLKIHVGHDNQQASAAVLQWLEEQCSANGLVPIASEAGAHCSVLLISSAKQWLHFTSLGHFLPEATDQYLPFSHLLSQNYPVVGYWGSDGGPYVLRRFTNEQVSARYAVYGAEQRFSSLATAELWNPILEDWRDLLVDADAAEAFYQLLPFPRHPDTPSPPFAFDYFDLPEHFNRLFGWNPELNYASIEFKPDGPAGRGDFYEPQSGDYVDTARGLRIYVRHYAHPTTGGYGEWSK